MTATREETFEAFWRTPMADRERLPTDDDGNPVFKCVQADTPLGSVLPQLDDTPSAFAVFGHPGTAMMVVTIAAALLVEHHKDCVSVSGTDMFSDLIDLAGAAARPTYMNLRVANRLLAVEIVWPEGWHDDRNNNRVGFNYR